MTSSRRQALAVLAGGALGAAAAGARRAVAADEVRLRVTWWGNPDRDRRTNALMEAYQKSHPNVRVLGEALGWGDYWAKLATQVAGGNAPDIIQMDYRYLFEYARRGVLQPLDGLVQLGDFSKPDLAAGKVDGKLYAVSLGASGWALYYNADLLEKLGIAAPAMGWSWDDYEALAQKVVAKTGGNPWGVADMGGEEAALEVWLLEQGKPLYDANGRPGFDQADIERWFTYWNGLRQKNLVPPPDITTAAMNGDLSRDEVVNGAAAVSFAGINQVIGLQTLSKAKLGMVSLPVMAGGRPGVYVKPGSFFTIARTSANAQAAAAFISWAVTDPEAGRILGVERGVPGSAAVRQSLQGKLDRPGQMMLDYMAWLGKDPAALPPPPPTGAGEIETMLKRTYPQIGFGRLEPKAAAEQFYTQARSIIARAAG
jgi:multiple sugar transport system substrate-binding protein